MILGHPGILNSTNFHSRLLKFRLSILQCALLSLPRCLGKYSAKVVATIETADLESLLCMGYSSPKRVSYNYTRKSLKSNQPAFKCQLDDIPVEELKICRYYIYILFKKKLCNHQREIIPSNIMSYQTCLLPSSFGASSSSSSSPRIRRKEVVVQLASAGIFSRMGQESHFKVLC